MGVSSLLNKAMLPAKAECFEEELIIAVA